MLTMPACRALLFCSAVLLLASCETVQGTGPTGEPAVDGASRTFAILHVNDVYRIDGLRLADLGGPARVRTLRTELERTFPDLLLMHGGDVFFVTVQRPPLDS